LNDKRPKLIKLLQDASIGKIVVEHSDRQTRFGFNYIDTLYKGKIVVINQADGDKDDLMRDFVSLVTSFVARLYGLRISKRKTERLIKELKNDKKINCKS
jgi:predicted site-specific integrase-resolvase